MNSFKFILYYKLKMISNFQWRWPPDINSRTSLIYLQLKLKVFSLRQPPKKNLFLKQVSLDQMNLQILIEVWTLSSWRLKLFLFVFFTISVIFHIRGSNQLPSHYFFAPHSTPKISLVAQHNQKKLTRTNSEFLRRPNDSNARTRLTRREKFLSNCWMLASSVMLLIHLFFSSLKSLAKMRRKCVAEEKHQKR